MLRETVYIVGISKVSPMSDRTSLPPFAYEDVESCCSIRQLTLYCALHLRQRQRQRQRQPQQ